MTIGIKLTNDKRTKPACRRMLSGRRKRKGISETQWCYDATDAPLSRPES